MAYLTVSRYFGTLFKLLFLQTFLCSAGYAYQAGYTNDVKKEKEQRFYEVFLLAGPPVENTNLKDAIFNRTLSLEFQRKYYERFGEFDFASISYLPTKYNLSDDHLRNTEKNVLLIERRREFAEFMTKRLTEFHVDNFFKSDPNMRMVYEAKEKISNVEVRVSKSVGINIKYGLAGNSMDLILLNPWIDSKVTMQMDPASFGPSEVLETRLWLTKNISKSQKVRFQAAEADGIAELEYIKNINKSWTGTIATSTAFQSEGTSPRESRLRVGIKTFF